MSDPKSPYQDGDWTIPQQDGRRKETFPFDFLGDGYVKTIERKYRELGTSYTGPATVDRNTAANYYIYSQDYSNGAWVKSGVTVSVDAVQNPWDGTYTADNILEAATLAFHGFGQTVNLPTATVPLVTTFFLWAIVKPLSRDYCFLQYIDASAVSYTGIFDITNGVLGATSNATSGMVSVGHGYYLVWITSGANAGSGTASLFPSATNGIAIYNGDVTKGVTVAQMQFEPNTYTGRPSALVQTIASTRSVSVPNTDYADNSTKNGDPFSFLISETPPVDSDLSLGLIGVTRKYGRLPPVEVEFTSRFVQRPVMDGAYIAPTYFTASVDDGVTSHIFNTRTAIILTGTVAATISPDVVSVVVASHNFNVGDEAVLWWGNGIVAKTPVLATAASYFYISIDAISVPSYAANFVQVTKNALMRVVNGNKNCSIRRSNYFYMPGYSFAGTIAVTTGADIPNYDVYTDPTAWLGRIVPTASAPTYAAVEVSAIGYYQGAPGSPILTQMVDEAQMSDALDTIPV